MSGGSRAQCSSYKISHRRCRLRLDILFSHFFSFFFFFILFNFVWRGISLHCLVRLIRYSVKVVRRRVRRERADDVVPLCWRLLFVVHCDALHVLKHPWKMKVLPARTMESVVSTAADFPSAHTAHTHDRRPHSPLNWWLDGGVACTHEVSLFISLHICAHRIEGKQR